MKREAAIVLSQGGGFQSYYNQRRDGSVPEEHLPVIGDVAQFCRARQAFCQGATPVPQIALLYSTAAHYREINGLFSRDLARIQGTLQALVESRRVVDVVGEHHLAGRMAEYPLVVVAECDYLDPAFKQQLVRYVENGGHLLLVGPRVAAMFASELGVTLVGARSEARHLACGDALVATRDATQVATLGPKARAFGQMHDANDVRSAAHPAASIAVLGKGTVGATYFSFSRGYLQERSARMRAFLDDFVREQVREPLVEIEGAAAVDVSVNRLGGRLAINLVNTSGAHWDAAKPLVDAIEPAGPFRVAIRLPARPAKITLQPEAQPVAFEYRDGAARLTVPRLEIHSILLVE